MDLDILVFPTPDSSYSWKASSSELLFIPRFAEIDSELKDININTKNNNEIKEEINDHIQPDIEKFERNKKHNNTEVLNNQIKTQKLNSKKSNFNIESIKSNDNKDLNIDGIMREDKYTNYKVFEERDIPIENEKFDIELNDKMNNNDVLNFESEKEVKKSDEELISELLEDEDFFPITDSNVSHIPCLFLKSTTNFQHSSKFALFFHGNAEDINLAYEILNHIRYSLNINVIAPEYPGYGIYPGRPSQEGIFEDTLIIYDFLTKTLKIPHQNIIIFGRSLGTSPSSFLASRKPLAGLILISPMLSIKNVARDILGKFVSFFLKDRFENYKYISKVECPILIIHGQNDALINYSHSTQLYNLSKAPCELILPEHMDHNEFDFFQEFSEPLLEFMSRNAIFAYTKEYTEEIPKKYFEVPECFKVPFSQWNFLTKILKKFSIN